VTIEINEGIIKEFRVQGNTKTKSVVILRELTLKPGDIYDSVQFRRDLEKIFALQLFEDITVDYELADDRQIIVIINVTEARTGQFGFGAGYSSQDGFLGEFTYTERNFRGMGQRIHLIGQIGGPNPDFMVSFYSPTIDKRGTSLTTEVFLLSSTDRVRNIDNPEEFTKFIMERKGASLGFVRPLNNTDDLATKISFLDGSIDIEGDVDPADYTEQLLEYMRRGLLEGTSNSVQLGFTRDTRDFALDPSEGFLGNITATYYGGLLGGDFDALKVSTEYRKYFKLNKEREQFVTGVSPARFHKNHVVAFRIFLGGATGGLSLFDSFKVGGSDSVRGTEEALQTGDKTILANLEYRFPIITNLSGALFVDSGAAAPPGESINLDGIVTSIGAGIRYRVPFFGIAPLRLDYGYDIKNGASRVVFGFGQIF
jgi:outer membrane protein insertion porin family